MHAKPHFETSRNGDHLTINTTGAKSHFGDTFLSPEHGPALGKLIDAQARPNGPVELTITSGAHQITDATDWGQFGQEADRLSRVVQDKGYAVTRAESGFNMRLNTDGAAVAKYWFRREAPGH